jgi:hypothetical protein
MNNTETNKVPSTNVLYGEIIYWVTVVACIMCMIGPVIAMANVDNNVLNPHYLFAAIFDGKDAHTVWEEVGGGFPGGHFYFSNLTKGDGFTQLGLALGCSCAFWALLVSAVSFFKRKVFLFVPLSLFVAGLIFLSMTGLVNMGH